MYIKDVFFHPKSGAPLLQDRDTLVCCGEILATYRNGIPRFLSNNSYSESFAIQWNKFFATQLDSYSGTNISSDRLSRCLGHLAHELEGKKVLEAGCGAGRFTEILLSRGAIVHAFDLTDAVIANQVNNGQHRNLVLAQADILNLPFKMNGYDLVLCLGVLQHTPSPEASVRELWKMVRPNGGSLVIDHYIRNWRISMPWPLGEALPLYRFALRRRSPDQRLRIVQRWVDFWFPIYWRFREFTSVRKVLRRISPVVFHYPDIQLPSREHYYEWALLDTHDGTTDFFKHRRTPKDIENLLNSLPGVSSIEIKLGGNGIEAKCTKL